MQTRVILHCSPLNLKILGAKEKKKKAFLQAEVVKCVSVGKQNSSRGAGDEPRDLRQALKEAQPKGIAAIATHRAGGSAHPQLCWPVLSVGTSVLPCVCV